MKLARRRLLALLGGAALALTATTTLGTTAASAASAPTQIRVVPSCDQDVRAGHYACLALRRADLGFTSAARVDAGPEATPAGYGPSSIQSAYALPSALSGSGTPRVYIVDAHDDPNAASDLAQYRSQYGLPACTVANGCFAKLNQNGATSPLPSADTGWAGEISLDLDMVSATCPKCRITLVEADDSDSNLYVAVKEATTLGAKFVSMSFGGPESGNEAAADARYFAPTGVVYTASTGDAGYQDGVIYPATSPDVVAVGGTSLRVAGDARGWSESVWSNSSTKGTGSGCSADESKPGWQNAVVPSSTCNQRADSDVSAVADPSTGVAVYQTYGGNGWAVYGGTSAAAPIIASVYALAGSPTAGERPPSVPYAHAASLNDVTTGNNGSCTRTLLCTAATGWDGPTGLGTPNGIAAFRAGTSTGGGTTCSGQHLLNPGFESGATGWSETAGVITTDGQYARTGDGYAFLDGYGMNHKDTLGQSVKIPAGCKATLTYYLDIASDDTSDIAHDTLVLGVNGTALQRFSNTGRAGGYVRRTVGLSAYAGKTAALRWTGTEDGSLATDFLIDDTSLTLS